MSHKCMSKMAVKTSKDTHKSDAELGTPWHAMAELIVQWPTAGAALRWRTSGAREARETREFIVTKDVSANI